METFSKFLTIPMTPRIRPESPRLLSPISGSRSINDYFDIILPLVTFPMNFFVVPLTDI